MGGNLHPIGRRRLKILLAGLGLAACAMAMILVVVFYGPPYNPMWWGIMVVVLLVVAPVATLLAPAIEWVMAGYREPSDR